HVLLKLPPNYDTDALKAALKGVADVRLETALRKIILAVFEHLGAAVPYSDTTMKLITSTLGVALIVSCASASSVKTKTVRVVAPLLVGSVKAFPGFGGGAVQAAPAVPPNNGYPYPVQGNPYPYMMMPQPPPQKDWTDIVPILLLLAGFAFLFLKIQDNNNANDNRRYNGDGASDYRYLDG
ncbi:hypothetical protein AURANDRAFT_69337, partial [Aureococcus anophagefferens]